MRRNPLRHQTRLWLRRHKPIVWFVLTKSWIVLLCMLPLLYLLFEVVAAGYLDPDDGMTGVWTLGFMLSSACIVVLLLFVSRSLCLELAIDANLLKTLQAVPNPSEAAQAKLDGFSKALANRQAIPNLRQALDADQPDPAPTKPSNSDQSVW